MRIKKMSRMNAYKCDNCGKIYDLNEKNPTLHLPKGLNIFTLDEAFLKGLPKTRKNSVDKRDDLEKLRDSINSILKTNETSKMSSKEKGIINQPHSLDFCNTKCFIEFININIDKKYVVDKNSSPNKLEV